jgi:hypothetical protein
MARRIKALLQPGLRKFEFAEGGLLGTGGIGMSGVSSSFGNGSANLLNIPPGVETFSKPSFGENLLGALPKIAEVGIPFATYLQNQSLINQTPDVAPPILAPNVNLKTDLNFDPAAQEIKEQAFTTAKTAGQNIVDPSVQASITLAAGAGAQREINQLRSGEINLETELENKKAILDQRAGTIRSGQINQFQGDVRDAQLDVQGKRSQNAALFQETVLGIIRDTKLDRNDRLAFVMMARALDTDGVISRQFADIIKRTNPQAWREFEAQGGTVGT